MSGAAGGAAGAVAAAKRNASAASNGSSIQPGDKVHTIDHVFTNEDGELIVKVSDDWDHLRPKRTQVFQRYEDHVAQKFLNAKISSSFYNSYFGTIEIIYKGKIEEDFEPNFSWQRQSNNYYAWWHYFMGIMLVLAFGSIGIAAIF